MSSTRPPACSPRSRCWRSRSSARSLPGWPRGVGLHRVTLLALVAVVVGLGLRARADSVPAFLLLSLLALAGMATANVLLPSLVKLHFPDRVGLMTSIYTTSLAVGLTLSSVLTVPVADAARLLARGARRLGADRPGRRAALGACWCGTTSPRRSRPHALTLGAVARTRLGWAMALFFGLQSLQAYAVFGWFAAGLPRRRLLAGDGRPAARRDHRDEHPAVVLAADARGADARTRTADRRAGRLLPDRVRRPDPRPGRGRLAVGGRSSARHRRCSRWH